MVNRIDDLQFDPQLPEFYEARKSYPLTVISGPNNSGKSVVLKWLKATAGINSYMIGTNRFYHVYHINTGLRNPEQELHSWQNQFISNFRQEQFNYEQNFYDLESIIRGLTDNKRDDLFKLCGELIGSSFSLKKVQEDNELSVRYIDMDGQNLSVGSTGTRLLMTMLGICMDERFETILIDEPELGLSPKVQQAFAKFLQDHESRHQIFPHLQRVFLATHSHIFLNRRDIQSNYVVSKSGNKISLNQITSIGGFHRLQFNLLGNSFESIFFPSAIVIVEGKSDYRFIERVLQVNFPEKKITVVQANGDSEIKRRVYMLKEVLGDLTRSPFRSRLFIVLDATHATGLAQELINMGVDSNNIVVWSKNGIEYYYPKEILSTIYSCDESLLSSLNIQGDIINLNGILRTKNQLSEDVTVRITPDSEYPEEFIRKLLSPIGVVIS